jgi:hypothetical protein
MADDLTPRDVIDVSAPETAEEKPSAIPQAELNRITDDIITAFKTLKSRLIFMSLA